MAVAFVDLLDNRQVALRLRGRTLPTALREIVHLLQANHKIDNPKNFIEEVLAREHKKPSPVERGIAFPHARTDLVDEIVLGIGRSRDGIRFSKNQRAHLIFVIAVPRRLVNDYLVCLGTLARILKDNATLEALMAVQTPVEFVDVLRRNAVTI